MFSNLKIGFENRMKQRSFVKGSDSSTTKTGQAIRDLGWNVETGIELRTERASVFQLFRAISVRVQTSEP